MYVYYCEHTSFGYYYHINSRDTLTLGDILNIAVSLRSCFMVPNTIDPLED